MPERILISPHLDDAALSCCTQLRSGLVDTVVTVFAGDVPAGASLSEWDRLTRARSVQERATERRAEDIAAWRSVGQLWRHLSFPDTELPPDAAAVSAQLQEVVETASSLLVPAGVGGHPHHKLVRDAVLASSAGIEVTLYGELPYAAYYGWPNRNTEFLDVEAYWRTALESGYAGRRRWKSRLTRLSKDTRAWKMKLLAHYRTQLEAVSGGSLDFASKTDLFSYELEFVEDSTS